ncbi:MAG TPA: IS110 family transposase [Longimicrobium sp.]
MPHPTRKDRQAIKKAQRRNRAHAAGAVVGVDAGKFKHCLVVRPKGGLDSRPFTFPVTRDGFELAEAYILRHAGGIVPEEILVGIEFAGIYGQTLAHALHARGFKIVSVPPAFTKAAKKISHGKRLKTDEKDAESITSLVGDGHFQDYPFLKPVYTGLRQLVSARERVTKLRGGAVTRLKSTLQITWPEFEAIFDDLEAKTAVAVLRTFPGPAEFLAARKARVLRVLQKASRGQLGEETYDQLREGATRSVALPGSLSALKKEVDLLLSQIAFYTEQVKTLEEAMKEAMEPLPEAQAVLTIPGVAPVAAAIFLGSIGDPKAYQSSRQILALAGLTLVEDSSGTRVGAVRISKEGRPLMRRLSFMLGLVAIRKKGIYRKEFEGLVSRMGGNKKPAVVAVGRKLLRLMYSVARAERVYTPEPPSRERKIAA